MEHTKHVYVNTKTSWKCINLVYDEYARPIACAKWKLMCIRM